MNKKNATILMMVSLSALMMFGCGKNQKSNVETSPIVISKNESIEDNITIIRTDNENIEKEISKENPLNNPEYLKLYNEYVEKYGEVVLVNGEYPSIDALKSNTFYMTDEAQKKFDEDSNWLHTREDFWYNLNDGLNEFLYAEGIYMEHFRIYDLDRHGLNFYLYFESLNDESLKVKCYYNRPESTVEWSFYSE